MGCTASKDSSSGKPKREILYGSNTELPDQRYLSDPPPRKHVTFDSPVKGGTRDSGEAARSEETFEAYANRGVISKSALLPEEKKSVCHGSSNTLLNWA